MILPDKAALDRPLSDAEGVAIREGANMVLRYLAALGTAPVDATAVLAWALGRLGHISGIEPSRFLGQAEAAYHASRAHDARERSMGN